MKFIAITILAIIPFLSGCTGTTLPPATTTATGNVDYSKSGVPSGNLTITLSPTQFSTPAPSK